MRNETLLLLFFFFRRARRASGVPGISVCRNVMALLVVLGEVVVLALARFVVVLLGLERSTGGVLMMVDAFPKLPSAENDRKNGSFIRYL